VVRTLVHDVAADGQQFVGRHRKRAAASLPAEPAAKTQFAIRELG